MYLEFWGCVLESFLFYYYWCFKFHMIRITGYGDIAEKPRVCQLGRIIPCTM